MDVAVVEEDNETKGREREQLRTVQCCHLKLTALKDDSLFPFVEKKQSMWYDRKIEKGVSI